jgi:hypothetical protein
LRSRFGTVFFVEPVQLVFADQMVDVKDSGEVVDLVFERLGP